MEKAEKVIQRQIDLIREIVGIIDSEINDINELGKVTLNNQFDDMRRAVLLDSKRRYATTFKKIAAFLSEKIGNETNKNSQFYLPNLRTLLEVYAHLLFLCHAKEDRQAVLCITRDLFLLASFVQHEGNEPVRERYEEGLKIYGSFLKNLGVSLPDNPLKLTYIFMKSNNLLFPSVREMLDKYNIKSSAVETAKLFPNITKDPYRFFAHFSIYVHGHPLFGSMSGQGNEKLWIISKALLLSSQFAELIDLKMLGGSRINEIKTWLKKVQESRAEFLSYWKTKLGSA